MNITQMDEIRCNNQGVKRFFWSWSPVMNVRLGSFSADCGAASITAAYAGIGDFQISEICPAWVTQSNSTFSTEDTRFALHSKNKEPRHVFVIPTKIEKNTLEQG
jgi:hypothetical protein